MAQVQVIILNGVGSVGKSSTARALQTIVVRPFLHVAMDAFIDMLPASMLGHPDGLMLEAIEGQEKRSVSVRSGPVVERAMRGMRLAVAAMAAAGNNLIVDEVMIGLDKAREYRSLLGRFEVRFVGLFAALEVVEARERGRGDRQLGLARWQYDRVHREMVYDLTIEAGRTTPLEHAEKIRDAFGL
ncbi:chloramphenicol phosphotransferase CPT family protein [Rhodopila sp.]|uniref:chloramphenicol phosphotransferase CPT family protein n=1 Tax=Rhodopila sp. TaxID=2480087 RepID=UPI003D096073